MITQLKIRSLNIVPCLYKHVVLVKRDTMCWACVMYSYIKMHEKDIRKVVVQSNVIPAARYLSLECTQLYIVRPIYHVEDRPSCINNVIIPDMRYRDDPTNMSGFIDAAYVAQDAIRCINKEYKYSRMNLLALHISMNDIWYWDRQMYRYVCSKIDRVHLKTCMPNGKTLAEWSSSIKDDEYSNFIRTKETAGILI